MPWLARPHSDDKTRWWVEHVVLTQHRTWVVTDEDDVVGFAAVAAGRLEHLYLRPDRRRQGIGSLLFRQVQAAEPTGFTLVVFARNTAARAFYERHGCRVVGAGNGSGNEEREPDVTYRWAP
ncbi:GNAT family N-acetyltransferase [Modestobacter sp. VKM Ac-2978]|uniref:GNAT family N-acetyltransferase n=1 Tax=Modestobacter sp. VKM Ac-2978 TaxID=3004132 RepID=UPI0022AAB791|nr:GNAT family N-acetyltransferase [Modestobacter sp. VKM Ac-2978]MCZ2847197.1 GNAT family N-acetyltransferase [Modestobacter sp. VKM Ac-2978]